ncbi:spondin domain-containing protein [Catenovulum sediminis]|uniref:Spondin domain-containing protein n=1 Tax=Catenovulum sediminis TaxID=1740262 RepID=A0ABV1RMD4_9ALTE
MKHLITGVHKLTLFSLITALSACSIDFNDDEDDHQDPMQETIAMYQITLTNNTQGQPFSPPSIVIHEADTHLWQLGQAANSALEKLAEGGDASDFAVQSGIKQAYHAEGPLAPGATGSWLVETHPSKGYQMSLATMLVNTNDAFTGLKNLNLSNLAIGESMMKTLHVYDAGTEANDESALPGPAAGGEGYNSARNDVNRVHIHAGVITEYELSGSVLQPTHKFDNPVAKIVIKRMQ